MIEKQQQEVMQQISEARKAGNTKCPRELWIELHPEVPTIEDFADCFRAVEAEEKKKPAPKKQQPAKGK